MSTNIFFPFYNEDELKHSKAEGRAESAKPTLKYWENAQEYIFFFNLQGRKGLGTSLKPKKNVWK